MKTGDSQEPEWRDGLDPVLRDVRDSAATVFAFKAELDKESDRGCALVAAAYLEAAVATLLKSFLVEMSRSTEKQLFDFGSPLGSFSGKIRMAHAMGLISNEIRIGLDLIRTIRNDFAHLEKPLDFAAVEMAQRVSALLPESGLSLKSVRATFIAKVQAVFANLQLQTLNANRRSTPPYKSPSIGSNLEDYEIELAALRLQEITAPRLTYEEAVDFARDVKKIGAG